MLLLCMGLNFKLSFSQNYNFRKTTLDVFESVHKASMEKQSCVQVYCKCVQVHAIIIDISKICEIIKGGAA